MTRIDLPREKKVGHLTLHRPPRTLSAKEFNTLSFDERLGMVRAASGRQKYQLILEAADAERLVRRLPTQEIFLLFKELGPEYAAELFPLVTTEQFTAFLDLDCWPGDTLDEAAALRWLLLLIDCGEEKILQAAQEIDFELLVLLVKKFVTVTRGPEANLDEDSVSERQMEGAYDVDYKDSESAKIFGAFLDLLFRRERDFFLHLMEAVRWESEASIEESAYHFRAGRLQDLGFPDPQEALAVYAYLEAESFHPDRFRREGARSGEGAEAPGFMLTAAEPRDLLADVLSGGIDQETGWELTWLLNKVMTADRVDLGDFEKVREETGEVYRYLNIALEHLAGSDADRAARLLGETYLQPLFRLGFSLTLDLQRRARQVKKSAIAPFLDGPFRALVEALDRRKPKFFEGMEDVTRAGERPFANLRDLGIARQWLERLEVQRRLFESKFPFGLPAPGELDLTGCSPADPEDLTLSDFFLTALANRILGRDFLPVPIPQAELTALHARICREGKVDESLRRETVQWLETLEPGAGGFGEWCLDLWDESFCDLEPGELDARYVSGLIARVE